MCIVSINTVHANMICFADKMKCKVKKVEFSSGQIGPNFHREFCIFSQIFTCRANFHVWTWNLQFLLSDFPLFTRINMQSKFKATWYYHFSTMYCKIWLVLIHQQRMQKYVIQNLLFCFILRLNPKKYTLHKWSFKNVIKGLVGRDLHVLAPGERSGPEDVVAPAQVDPAPLLQLLQGCVAPFWP